MEHKVAELALGRILRIAARPTQPGDVEEYHRCRGLILDALGEQPAAYQVSFAREYGRGAQGQWR